MMTRCDYRGPEFELAFYRDPKSIYALGPSYFLASINLALRGFDFNLTVVCYLSLREFGDLQMETPRLAK